MLAVPVMSAWIMPWALLGFLLLPFGVEALALYPMGLGLDLVLWWAEIIAGLPLAVVPVAAFSTTAILAMVFGGLWLVIWRSRWRFLGWGHSCLDWSSPSRQTFPIS